MTDVNLLTIVVAVCSILIWAALDKIQIGLAPNVSRMRFKRLKTLFNDADIVIAVPVKSHRYRGNPYLLII